MSPLEQLLFGRAKSAPPDLLNFSDVPNWRSRELEGQMAPGRAGLPAPYSSQYEALPPSSNIEDDRNTSLGRQLMLDWLMFTPEQLAKMFRNPLTPYDTLFPAKPMPGPSVLGDLSEAAGYWNIK